MRPLGRTFLFNLRFRSISLWHHSLFSGTTSYPVAVILITTRQQDNLAITLGKLIYGTYLVNAKHVIPTDYSFMNLY